MSRINRLAIISTIVWIVIVILIFICRYPAEDLITEAVEATMQARTGEYLAATTDVSDMGGAVINDTPAAPTLAPTLTIAPTEDPICLYAKMVMETVPDGTQVSRGESFTKTWVLENTGSCAWNPGFKLVFTGGEHMQGPSLVSISETVVPGERVTISVELTAPTFTGSARGSWMLQSIEDVRFAPIWVQIDVIS